MALSLIYFMVSLVISASCQLDAPLPSNFLRRVWHTAAILGDYLYIDGGEISQLVDGKETNFRMMNSTLSLPLNQPWTNANTSWRVIPKSIPVFKGSTSWVDEFTNTFYSWTGDVRDVNASGLEDGVSKLWSFNADGAGGGSWAVAPETSNTDVYGSLLGTALGAGTACNGIGVNLGGYGNSMTDKSLSRHAIPVPGLLTYNFRSKEWANETADPNLNNYVYGTAVCLPWLGRGGLVLFLGGNSMPANDSIANAGQNRGVGFSPLIFYEPSTKNWYRQTVNGTVSFRGNICAVAVQGPNGTSEVHLYGGVDYTDRNYNTLSGTYVLTIPGFMWFQTGGGTQRRGQTCVLAGNRQMISIGGSVADTKNGYKQESNPGEPDPWQQGIRVFDMSSLTWKDTFDPNAGPYEQPQRIKDFYNSGGFNSVNWSAPENKNLFAANFTWYGNLTLPTNTTQSTASPSSSPPTNTGRNSDVKPDHAGVIAGGVIGSLALLGASILGLCFFRRRCNWKRKQQKERAPVSQVVSVARDSPGNDANHEPYGWKSELDSSTRHEMPAVHEQSELYYAPGMGETTRPHLVQSNNVNELSEMP